MDTITRTGALDELRRRVQWVNWTYSGSSKIPIQPHSGQHAKTNDVDTWSGYNAAQTASKKNNKRGVGFVLSEYDPFSAIDLDKVINLETGEIAPWAMDIIEELDSYTEFSPSGTGLHIWIRGELPGTGKNKDGIEVYDRARFITWTGEVFNDATIEDRQVELDSLYSSLFDTGDATEINTGGYAGNSVEDTQLLEMARRSSSGNIFSKLYDHGDWTGTKSKSEADIKLAGMLAFWTGKDAQRIETLMWRSRLASDKWREHRSYLSTTIEKAVRRCTKTYDPDYRKASRKTLESHIAALEWFAVGTYNWPGRGGPTDRDVYRALLEIAATYGKPRRDGIEVAYSLTDIALTSGVGRVGTVRDALARLQDKHGVLERVSSGSAREAARYRIQLSNDVVVTESHKPSHTINRDNPYVTGSTTTTTKIRNYSPLIGTIGKLAAQVLDYVQIQESGATLQTIADHMQRTKKSQKHNLKRGPVRKLLEEGFIVEEDGVYTTPEDIQTRLEEFLEESGHNREHRIQAERYRLAREAFHNPKNNKVPTVEELDSEIPETSDPNRVYPTSVEELVISTKEFILLADSLTIYRESDWITHPIDCDCIPCSMPPPQYAQPKMLPGDTAFHMKRRVF